MKASDSRSLSQIYPRSFHVPALIVVAVVFLFLGLFLPAITLKEMFMFRHTFSVVDGIVALYQDKHYVLALVIFLFSILFPFVKFIFLTILWFSRMTNLQREKILHWMARLGKWSMLDVFVVAITIVMAKISGFATAKAEKGIYFFGVSVVISITLTMLIENILQKNKVKKESV